MTTAEIQQEIETHKQEHEFVVKYNAMSVEERLEHLWGGINEERDNIK